MEKIYGWNIVIGDNFYANYDCTIIDVCDVIIGNNVFLRLVFLYLPHPTLLTMQSETPVLNTENRLQFVIMSGLAAVQLLILV